MGGSAERVNAHRRRLREAGLRAVQLWAPDTRLPAFAAECRRQSLTLLDKPQEVETLAWLAAAADREGWV